MADKQSETREQTKTEVGVPLSYSYPDLDSRPYWMDEALLHNCGSPSWREKEAVSFNSLLDMDLEESESSQAVESILKDTVFPENSQKVEHTMINTKKLTVPVQTRRTHSNPTLRENSWLGLDEYKRQKLEMMYPKNYEREHFLLKEVYRRLLLQKLQFTLGELEEYRRKGGIKLNKSNLQSPFLPKTVSLSTINPSNQIYVPKNPAHVSSQDIVFQPLQQLNKLKRRPLSASSIPSFGPNDVDNQNFLLARRSFASNAEALDLEVKNKELDCQNIYSFLTRTEDGMTTVRVTDSMTSSLMRAMSGNNINNTNSQHLGPYKVAQAATKSSKKTPANLIKNGSMQQSQHLSKPFSGLKILEPAAIVVKQKIENHLRPDRKYVLSKKPPIRPYRFTASLLLSNPDSLQLEPNSNFLKKVEVTDIDDIRQSVESQPFSE